MATTLNCPSCDTPIDFHNPFASLLEDAHICPTCDRPFCIGYEEANDYNGEFFYLWKGEESS